MVKRGEVWLATLELGSEIRKTRPCLVVSPPEMNAHLRTAIVAPLTRGSQPAPFRVPVRFSGKSGLILLDQIRTIDQQRLVKRLGAVGGRTLTVTLSLLQEVFAP